MRPQFVHAGYLERTLIHKEDIKSICRVVRDAAERYVGQLESGESEYAVRCDLSSITHHDRFIAPGPETRQLEYCSLRFRHTAAVQVTLKPVQSFLQARGGFESELVGNDVRTTFVGWIQESLDLEGLGKYGARPGGRTSIDITLEQLDKASALQFLIDHLRLGDSRRRGQPFGSNAIYFRDEVMVGRGNDYPVTRIPGLMVFAVNPTSSTLYEFGQVSACNRPIASSPADRPEGFLPTRYRALMLKNTRPSTGAAVPLPKRR